MKKSINMKSQYVWLLLCSLILVLSGCGGGGNNVRKTVFLSLSFNDSGDFVEAEMFKDVTTNTATATVTVGTNFDTVDTSVGTVSMDRYEISFVRQDGSSIVPETVTGGIDVTISAASSANLSATGSWEVEVMRTFEKTYSDFALDWHANGMKPITMDATLRVWGTNNAGDTLTASAGFKVQAAVYNPIDSLLPVISSFSEVDTVTLGNDYLASWSVLNGADFGAFILPFGGSYALGGNQFPVGGISLNTGFLLNDIPSGEIQEYPGGVLLASNEWGTVQASGDLVTVENKTVAVDLIDLAIDTFFPDRSTINEGESVLLTWSTSGGADSVGISPNTYSGDILDLSGKDPAFDSVTITPEFSVRPLLRADRNVDGASATSFLSDTITVTTEASIPDVPVSIAYFQASRTTISRGLPVVFFWHVDGDVEKVELFPVVNARKDVTDLNTFVSPIHVDAGSYTYNLVATGVGGSIAISSVTITVVEEVNQAIEILNVNQQPSATIDNQDEASFSFRLSDPERFDSSWRVDKIAGDTVAHGPSSGKITDGLGDVGVSVVDDVGNENGFFTFEINAWDDTTFGGERNSTHAVELVTFTTTGSLSDTAPTIDSAEFIPSGDETVPGATGVINFTFSDPDTLNLDWRVLMVSGDTGGSLSPSRGSVSTGSGDIYVNYEDDIDTPIDPVVFYIRVSEAIQNNPQRDIFLLRVEKGTPTDDDGEPTTAEGAISFDDDGLFDNLFGGVNPAQQIGNYTLYSNGSIAAPVFFKNSDLSSVVTGVSMVVDLSHTSTDPSQIDGVNYARDFALPSTLDKNTGVLDFVGYFANSGASGAGASDPIPNGVSRWSLTFGTSSFLNDLTATYNLPATGASVYNIALTASDKSGSSATFSRVLAVRVP